MPSSESIQPFSSSKHFFSFQTVFFLSFFCLSNLRILSKHKNVLISLINSWFYEWQSQEDDEEERRRRR